MELNRQRNNKRFAIMWIFLAFGLFITYYDAWCKPYNTTLLTFSYKYGFISRGLLGTIYQWIGQVLHINVFDYAVAMRFMEVVTALFFLLLFVFLMSCLKYSSDKVKRQMMFLIALYTIFTIPTFSCNFNFGRIDLFMLSMTLIAVTLIVHEKCEWLVIPLTALGIMFHQGYAFMFYNAVLVLLFYKILSVKDAKRKKHYITIMVVSLVICIGLFFWFQLFSHGNAKEYVQEIVSNAKAIALDGDYHKGLIRAEILGVDLTAEERKYRSCNIEEIIAFSILFMPYIVVLIQFLRGLVKHAVDRREKLKYWAVSIGALTMLPDFLLKVDFGRWVYAVINYYMITIICLLTVHDENVENQIQKVAEKIHKKPWGIFFLVYPILFVPFNDIVIAETVDRVCILLRQFL